MADGTRPFDTALFEKFPIAGVVYEPVNGLDGTPKDFRIVYGNEAFADGWHSVWPDTPFVGALAGRDGILDDESMELVKRCRTEKAKPFASFLPRALRYVRFQPVPDMPEPYGAFFVTRVTDFEYQDAKLHFLRNIIQMNANGVLMRRHDDGHLEAVYASDAFAAMMECETAEEARQMMDGLKFFKSTHPEDRPFVRSMLRRRVTDDGSSDLTIQKITAKRHKIWVRCHYAFIDDFGEHYIFCTCTDVTVLKAYEERLRSVYVSLGNNFYQNGPDTLSLFRVNLTKNAVEEVKGRDMYGSDTVTLPYSEVMLRRARHYPIGWERERFLQTFQRERLSAGYLAGISTASEMVYSRRRDGRMCYVSITATLTRHPLTGDMIAFITEEERNDEKVRETLMNTVLAQQFDMVAWLSEGRYGVTIGDAERIQQGSIFPTSREGSYTHYMFEQVFPVLRGTEEEKEQLREALSLQNVEQEAVMRGSYSVMVPITIDGESFDKRFDFYDVDPESRFFIVLKSDITESRREQRERNEQLQTALKAANEANVAKSAFLSSMSHEIRTPMNAIIGLDEIALRDADLPARTRDQLEKIGVSAKHLLGLINNILDMSRIDEGRMELKNEEFAFNDFLNQVCTLVSSQCQDKGLEFVCSVNGPMDEYYIGDDMRLKQILINILGNSVKFTDSPGTVTLTVNRQSSFEGRSALRFSMKDTGIGMDPEYVPKIFEPFSQEDATTTNRYGGSGLGMAITKRFVEMMNGTITVKSEKGVGSEFIVTVTLRNSARTAEEDRELRPQELKVLVVDDDPVALEHARLVLEENGISPDLCASAKEALDLIRLRRARREAYSLILADFRMPEQDGLELAKAVRAEDGGDDSAIIILTAFSWEDIEDQAREAGVDAFLSKPLSASSLLYEFHQALLRKKSDTPEKQKAELEGRHILLAEDMEINAEIMLELLDMRGMTAEHAENGQIAVELFKKGGPHHFDAVLMDVRMPVMDGLHAAAAIRALDQADAKTVPIIAMTANAFDEDVERSLQAGMTAHLTKPVEPDRLYATLEELIQG